MGINFLLTKEAREISGSKMMMLSNERAMKLFAKIRWANNNGKPVCPKRKNCKKIYFLKTTKRFKCPECFHQFSVTSGTLFSDRKLPLKYYLATLGFFINSAKSISALFLSRELGIEHKSAWVLLQKIREVLEEHNYDTPFEGECEMDGVYQGHYIRPRNHRSQRIDRRKFIKNTKVAIVSLRERVSLKERMQGLSGSFKTKAFVLKHENAKEINQIAHQHIKQKSTIYADENNAYDDLQAHYNLKRVNHSLEYCGAEGENNNQCESYNSRFRRMFYGVIHRSSLMYISKYANEIAYREDIRRTPTKKVFKDLLFRCLNSPPSSEMCGVWQGNRRIHPKIGVW